MGEIADELREMEMSDGCSFFERMFQSDNYLRQKQRFNANANNNSVWTDQNGRTQSFMEMDGFHLWNVRTFIINSGKRGLMNRIPYIDRALRAKGYTVEEYRKDCENLRKESEEN